MPSIQTPAYPPVEHASPFLPPLIQRTPELVWEKVTAWPYWSEIQRVAQKEYGISQVAFNQLLPEYQKFLTIILMGYQGVGMFSGEVDKVETIPFWGLTAVLPKCSPTEINKKDLPFSPVHE
ncbi:MAG TPA: hypothetical protein VFV38_20095 [Ktedonobacteraceae bacterium]|nr:hypothetical protein [Ktedonobacteraceae bacterium]